MAKTDCFAYKKNRCEVLEECVCNTKDCSFYKSVEQHESDLEKYPLIDYEALYDEKHKITPKADCFAYNGRNCNILTVCICKRKKDCGFYKTKERVAQDKIKYPYCDYAALYEERHKNDKKGVITNET